MLSQIQPHDMSIKKTFGRGRYTAVYYNYGGDELDAIFIFAVNKHQLKSKPFDLAFTQSHRSPCAIFNSRKDGWNDAIDYVLYLNDRHLSEHHDPGLMFDIADNDGGGVDLWIVPKQEPDRHMFVDKYSMHEKVTIHLIKRNINIVASPDHTTKWIIENNSPKTISEIYNEMDNRRIVHDLRIAKYICQLP